MKNIISNICIWILFLLWGFYIIVWIVLLIDTCIHHPLRILSFIIFAVFFGLVIYWASLNNNFKNE